MARKEAIFTAKVDTGSSVNDVKKLEKEMVDLNDQMEQLSNNGEQNTTAFKDLSKAFDKTQNDLKKFSGDMEHLGGDILVEVTGSISKMEDRMYELALAGDTTSKEFRDLQTQTAKYKKIIIETDRSIDALAEQGRGLSTALSISSGAVAGFQAFTGVTALLGSENEELLETITKLQAAQGVLNSIETIKQQLDANSIVLTRAKTKVQKLYNLAIGNGTKGMKLFRGAMLATGIGALIIGVGLLIANFDKLKGMLLGTTKAQETMNAVTDTAVDSIAKELSASDKLQKQLADETLTREQKVQAVKDLQAKYPNLLSNIDAEKDGIEKTNEALILNTELLLLKAQQNALISLGEEELKIQMKEQIRLQTGQNVGVWDSVLGFSAKVAGLGEVINAESIANQGSKETISTSKETTEAYDELNKSLQDKIDLKIKEGAVDGKAQADAKAKADAEAKAKADANAKAKTRAKERESARLKEQEQINQFLLEQSELEDELFKMRLSANELEEQAVADKYDALMLKAHGNAELEKQLIIQQEAELTTLRKGFADKTALDQATAIETANALRHSLMRDSITEDLVILEEKYQAEREALQTNELISSEEKIVLMNEILEREKAEEDAIKVKWRDKELADEKILQDKKKSLRDANIQNTENGLNALSSLNNLVSDLQLKNAKGNSVEEEKIRKASFQRNKAMQLGMAVIDSYKAITASLTTSPLTILGVPNPGALGALIATASMSALNIAKIASTQYSSGGGGASGSVPNLSSGGGAGASASSFAISDDTSSVQTQLNADGTQAGANGQTQVVVVETDITTAVNNVAQINEVSTF